jgi:DNA invertase Pin-like site-specific DNA recombinase
VIAAIYARKSTEQNVADDAKSVTRQIENAKTFATERGWTVDDRFIFSDDGISGAETTKLRAKQALLQLATTGAFQVVIMQAQDRFSRRDGDEAFTELKSLARHVDIWFYADGRKFEHGTLATNVVGLLGAEFSAEFRRIVAVKTSECMRRKAEAGHLCGGRTFGYTNIRTNGHVDRTINEPEAAVVRKIFQLTGAGVGRSRLARQLNREQALSPRMQEGRPVGWAASSISAVLARELYRGILVWGKTKKRAPGGQRKQTKRPAHDWVQILRPDLRIVSDDLWTAARARIDATAAHHKLRGRVRDADSKYLLTNFVRCGICAGGMHVRTRDHHGATRVPHYACTTHYTKPDVCGHVAVWPMKEIDREVLNAIVGDVLAPKAIEAIVADARQTFDAAARVDRRDELQRALATVERELARLTDAVQNGAGAIPTLIERLRATDAKRVALLADLTRLPAASARPPVWSRIERHMRQQLADWQSMLTSDDVPRLRDGFRKALSGSIRLTPFVHRGYRALRFEGQVDLGAVFGGELVTTDVSPSGRARAPLHEASAE